MRKKLTTIIGLVCALALLGGCGQISDDYVTIKKYKGLEVEKYEAIEVTDVDVEGSIAMELETFSEKVEVTDRAAKMWDTTYIDFVGKKDGVAFEGGTAKNYELELGSHSFIDGFEEGIVGHKIGETFDLNLEFPKNYHSAELAGQKVVFTVTLNRLMGYPELTDEMLPQIGTSAKTVAEYREQVKKDLEKSNKEEAEEQTRNAALNALLEQTTVKTYPSGLIDSYIAKIEEDYGYVASLNQMQVSQFIQAALGVTIEDFAKINATKDLAVALVAEKEGIQITDEEYTKLLEEDAKAQGYQTAEEYEATHGKDGLRQIFLEDKVINVLLDNCKFVEPKETE